nr:glycoprotein precursor [Pear chlorotic leaf spot-associated virus]BCM23434.1 glycoprotein precursor [Pear chlorotic leaf spot-associated virus]BCM23444.1 glycoprotein precursor [Pear chlorotic leaf spot-associated virus]
MLKCVKSYIFVSVICSILLVTIFTINGVKTKKGSCSCEFSLKQEDMIYFVLVPDDACKFETASRTTISGDRIYSESDMITILCKGELMTFEKPTYYSGCKYLSKSSCALYLSLKSFFNHLLSYLFFYIIRTPLTFLCALCYSLVLFIFRNRLRSCEACGRKYLFYHNCLYPVKFNLKNIYLVLILVIHILSLKVTATLEHSVIQTSGGSIINLPDIPGVIHKFEYNGHILEIQLHSSTALYSIEHIHDVLMVGSPTIVDSASTCELRMADCTNKLKTKSADYTFTKLKDSFACFVNQLKVCFTCTNDYAIVGRVVKLNYRHLIIAKTAWLNGKKTNKVQFDKRTPNPPLLDTDRLYFIALDDTFYAGNICQQPSESCWGKNIVTKSGDVLLYKKVEIKDQPGKGFSLLQCAIPDHTYVTSLQQINANVVKDQLVHNVKLSSVTLNLEQIPKPIASVCDGNMNIMVRSEGCYSCPQGYLVHMSSDCGSCCNITCQFNNETRNIIMGKNDTIRQHLYSDVRDVHMICSNNQEFNFELEKQSYEAHIVSDQAHIVDPIESFSLNLNPFKEVERFLTNAGMVLVVGLASVLILKSFMIFRAATPVELFRHAKFKQL